MNAISLTTLRISAVSDGMIEMISQQQRYYTVVAHLLEKKKRVKKKQSSMLACDIHIYFSNKINKI